uniref:H15 domain-containing protein n=1 Tax=Laticauda laticaudata TaxID=8630 RepID=A0A8C5T1R1_LATLA
ILNIRYASAPSAFRDSARNSPRSPSDVSSYNIFSLAALKKSLAASGYDVEKNNSRLKLVLRSLVTKGMLLQIKGTGASGSFKLNKKWADPKDKATHNQQLAGAKKVKRAAGAAGVKKAVNKPASVVAKKPKSPAKPLKAKAKLPPRPILHLKRSEAPVALLQPNGSFQSHSKLS